MVLYTPGLIPARFLTLLAHLTVLILILFSRKENIESCMPLEWDDSEFILKDNQLVIGLSISIVLVGIELIGFLSGVSMFMCLSTLISIAGHFSGSIALSYFIFDQWDCNIFWWIFTFCSLIPGLVEIVTGIKVFKFNLQVPEKFKGTVIEKWFKYWEGLINDYSEVFRDTFTECKSKPYKTGTYFATGSFLTYALYNNPTVQDYRDSVINYQNLFGLTGHPIRNPGADVYLKSLENSFNFGLIRRFSFGVFCIIWVDNYDEALGLYKAQCEYLKPMFLTFHQRIIDVGFLKKFWILERNMKDYDVNPNEWIDFSKSEYKYKNTIL